MQPADMILVSVDDHAIEPPNLFTDNLPPDLHEAAPKLVRHESGADMWVFEDAVVPNVALNAVAGRPPEEYGFEPTSFDDIRPGTWDVAERVKDMNAGGLLGSLCFPSMTGFCGQLFAKAKDPKVGLRLLQAYNDWHINDWCGAAPGRFIPLMVPPSWDPQQMAKEVRRTSAMGCHAVTFSENPSRLGWPSFHSEYWDPFWKACVDEGTIVCMHIGSSSQLIITATDAPVDVTIALTPFNLAMASADLIFSRVMKEFPDLRIALSEGGIGWMPYFLERINYVYEHHRAWTHQDFGDRLPSQVFNERFITCFIDDRAGLEAKHHLNMTNITWECDYPHSDSTWPQAPELLHKATEGLLTDAEIDQVTHLNAMKHFRYDPFAVRPREHCTVGALRALESGRDLTWTTGRKSSTSAGAADLAALATKQTG